MLSGAGIGQQEVRRWQPQNPNPVGKQWYDEADAQAQALATMSAAEKKLMDDLEGIWDDELDNYADMVKNKAQADEDYYRDIKKMEADYDRDIRRMRQDLAKDIKQDAATAKLEEKHTKESFELEWGPIGEKYQGGCAQGNTTEGIRG